MNRGLVSVPGTQEALLCTHTRLSFWEGIPAWMSSSVLLQAELNQHRAL
jgi:hypothetical protein